jgi:hypothetical protein
MRVVEDKEISLGSVDGCSVLLTPGRDTIVALQSPDNILEIVPPTRSTRKENLGVEAIDEGRVEVELRLRTEEMLEPIHDAKIRKN